MATKTCLLLALSRLGWGETTFGLHVAHELTTRGYRCVFLAAEGSRALLRKSGFECEYLGDHLGGLAQLFIETWLKDYQVGLVVLADFLTCTGVLRDGGVDPRFLLSTGIPTVGVDTWSLSGSHRPIDMFIGKSRPVTGWISELPLRIAPSPIASVSTEPAACQFLPKSMPVTNRIRSHVRANLGLMEEEKIILFCTAAWQHAMYADENGERIAGAIPELVGRYCLQTGPRVHVVHVGTQQLESLQTSLAERYHWIGSLPQTEFDALLGSSDLLLSLNISAATIGKAIAIGIPVLVLRNSFSSDCNGELTEKTHFGVTEWVGEWLRRASPIYPFWLWPLGFYSFLEPILRENPYLSAVTVAECLDESTVVNLMQQLLYDQRARVDLLNRQSAYKSAVARLPTAIELVEP